MLRPRILQGLKVRAVGVQTSRKIGAGVLQHLREDVCQPVATCKELFGNLGTLQLLAFCGHDSLLFYFTNILIIREATLGRIMGEYNKKNEGRAREGMSHMVNCTTREL